MKPYNSIGTYTTFFFVASSSFDDELEPLDFLAVVSFCFLLAGGLSCSSDEADDDDDDHESEEELEEDDEEEEERLASVLEA